MAKSTTQIISKIDFFDFMKCFFCDDVKYQCITRKAKSQHLFMFFRMMSIAYPVQMHTFGYIHDVRIMDALHKIFYSPVAKYPGWMYQKTDKVASATKKKELFEEFSKEVLYKFMEATGMEWKALLFYSDFDEVSLRADLNEITSSMENTMSKPSKVKPTKNLRNLNS